jgi:protein-S-isoprenylcysteine O-methyltransferase Ste14
MVARAFVWFGGALFVGALLVCAWSYLFVLGQPQPSGGATALLVDAGLVTVFALHHSLFARESVKRVFGSLPAQIVRSIYVSVASLLLITVCLAWRPIGGELYHATGVRGIGQILVQLAGLWCIARAVAKIDPLELAGIRPESRRDGLQTLGVYAWVRHPLYLGWVLAVFGAPHMTGDRLAFAVMTTFYLIVAVPFEERSLRRSFGEDYARYTRAVKWRMIPFIY